MTCDSGPLLQVKDLHVGFGRRDPIRDVVHGVSFDLGQGETLAIVGESGSGKSVTALCLNRLIDHAGGHITHGTITLNLDDRPPIDIGTADERMLERLRGNDISMIFQEPMTALNPVHTVGRQVMEAFRLHQDLDSRAAREAMLTSLARVRIPDAERRQHYYPHQFSGGMRQRIMIAMAFACNPRILIADEPTTALDVTVQAQTIALLAQLREEHGMASIFITHDMALVSETADRVLVMQHGKIVEQGPVDEVLRSPQHPYTKHLVDAVPHFRHGEAAPRRTERPHEELLVIDDLSVHFPIKGGWFGKGRGSVHAVDQVTFNLRSNETLAIVGESGCGKSTTARAILGLAKQTGGTIRFDADPSRQNGNARAAQIVFQDAFASLNPRLKIKQILLEPVVAQKRPNPEGVLEDIVYLLERVGLNADALSKYPHEFSGGQRQRICIARALVTKPRIVVLDEPVSALDVSVQAQTIDLLDDLQREFGLSYIFISHDLGVVERIAHRVAVMYGGQIVEIGNAKSVLSKPGHSYSKRLIAAVPSIERRKREFAVDEREIPSLIRPVGFVAKNAEWKTLGDDHLVRVEG